MAPKTRAKKQGAAASDQRAGIIDAVGRAGPHGLAALIALCAEALPALWFTHAESAGERITAGILMAIIFLALIGLIGWIESIRRPSQAPPPSPTVQQVVATLDHEGLPEPEIERVVRASATNNGESEEPIAPSDGSYLIARPPVGWTMHPTTLEEIVEEKTGLRASDFPVAFKTIGPVVSSILALEFGTPLGTTPLSDRTRVNGRRYPLLLLEPASRKLQITTMRRRQPPLYVERTLYDVVFAHLAHQVRTGILSIASVTPGKLPKTNRDMIIVEMKTELENVLVGGREVDLLHLNYGVTAIRGDVYDYVLAAVNYRIRRASDPRTEREDTEVAERVDTEIAKLFGSFRLLSVPDPDAEARKDSERADRDFDKFVATHAPVMLTQQLVLAIARLRNVNLDNRPGLAQAVGLLRPFQRFAAMLPADLAPNELWTALDQAELGDALLLRHLLPNAIARATVRLMQPPPGPLSIAPSGFTRPGNDRGSLNTVQPGTAAELDRKSFN
jgi:hypothetical protein